MILFATARVFLGAGARALHRRRLGESATGQCTLSLSFSPTQAQRALDQRVVQNFGTPPTRTLGGAALKAPSLFPPSPPLSPPPSDSAPQASPLPISKTAEFAFLLFCAVPRATLFWAKGAAPAARARRTHSSI